MPQLRREFDCPGVQHVEVGEVRFCVVLVRQLQGDVLLQLVVVHVQHELAHDLLGIGKYLQQGSIRIYIAERKLEEKKKCEDCNSPVQSVSNWFRRGVPRP